MVGGGRRSFQHPAAQLREIYFLFTTTFCAASCTSAVMLEASKQHARETYMISQHFGSEISLRSAAIRMGLWATKKVNTCVTEPELGWFCSGFCWERKGASQAKISVMEAQCGKQFFF